MPKQFFIDETAVAELVAFNPEGNTPAIINATIRQAIELHKLTAKLYPVSGPEAVPAIIDRHVQLHTRTLARLRGRFNRNEIAAMLNAFNGTMIQGFFLPAADLLRAQMEDADTYEASAQMYDYDLPALLAKLEGLSELEAETWLAELLRFWSENVEIGNFLTHYEAA